MVMGLNTGLWVSAQVRICDRAFIPATVVRRGDPDAGTVLLKINRFEDGVTVYTQDRKSTRLNSSHANISYAVFCLKKKKKAEGIQTVPKTHSRGVGQS